MNGLEAAFKCNKLDNSFLYQNLKFVQCEQFKNK